MFAVQTVCIVDIGVSSGTLLIAHTVAPECVEICSVNDQGFFYAEIGRRVRLARERIGLTQDSLAAQIMLSRTSVTNIEKGRQKVLAHTICRLAGALNVLPAELLPDTPPLSESEGEAREKMDSPRAREAVIVKKKRGKRPAHFG